MEQINRGIQPRNKYRLHRRYETNSETQRHETHKTGNTIPNESTKEIRPRTVLLTVPQNRVREIKKRYRKKKWKKGDD